MTLRARARRLAVRGSRAWYRFRGPRQPGPPEPPVVPEGWRVGPPHYVGIGAQKAGTSWWSRLIEAHPDVVSAGGLKKELHYFDRSWEVPFGDAEVERYHRYFPVPVGKVAGEWTPGYLIDFWAPELIARAAPDARILVLLRDPVERLRSGLTHQLATSREPLRHRDIQGAFQRGMYAPQLRRVLAAFSPEQLWVGQYEACRADPGRELARTYAFLGLSPYVPDGRVFRGEVNPTTGEKFELSGALHSALLEGYASDMAEVAALLPDLDLALWPSAKQAGLA